MTRRQAAAGRHGAAQRPARARPDALGRGRAHATAAPSRSRRGASRGCAAPTAIPGVRGVARLAEAFAVIPLVKRGLPEARLPFQDPAVLAVAAGASAGGVLLRRRVRGATGEVAAAAVSFVPALFALRGGELAQYHGVEHKAIGAYEADADDAARRRPRSTSAAARTSSRRCWPPTSRARCCCAGRSRSRARSRAARSRWPRPRWPSRSSAGASGTPTRARARALKRPGFEIQRLVGHARARRAPARGRRARRWPRSCASRRRSSAREPARAALPCQAVADAEDGGERRRRLTLRARPLTSTADEAPTVSAQLALTSPDRRRPGQASAHEAEARALQRRSRRHDRARLHGLDQAGVRPPRREDRRPLRRPGRQTTEQWAKDIATTQGTAPNYPLIADSDHSIAKAYGMLPSDVEGDPTQRTPAQNQTLRNVFVIGPDKKIKLRADLSDDRPGGNFDEVLARDRLAAAHRRPPARHARPVAARRRRDHRGLGEPTSRPRSATRTAGSSRCRTCGSSPRRSRRGRVFGRIDHVGVAVSDLEAAIAAARATYGMRVAHRETVAEQGVEAVLLDVGRTTSSCSRRSADDTPVGRFLAKRGPGPAPRRLPGGRHRRGARARCAPPACG